jgi:hypothetical protein
MHLWTQEARSENQGSLNPCRQMMCVIYVMYSVLCAILRFALVMGSHLLV